MFTPVEFVKRAHLSRQIKKEINLAAMVMGVTPQWTPQCRIHFDATNHPDIPYIYGKFRIAMDPRGFPSIFVPGLGVGRIHAFTTDFTIHPSVIWNMVLARRPWMLKLNEFELFDIWANPNPSQRKRARCADYHPNDIGSNPTNYYPTNSDFQSVADGPSGHPY